jgi:predicted transcriptional regulator
MSTTTIRIEDDLKSRVTVAAERAGKTAHAFILDAIAQTVEQAELDHELHRVAGERWEKLLMTGRSVAWDDAKAYLERRANGEKVKKPSSRRVER